MTNKKSNAPYILAGIMIFVVILAMASMVKTNKERQRSEEKVQQQELLLEEIEEATACKNLRTKLNTPTGMIWDSTEEVGKCYMWNTKRETWDLYEANDDESWQAP